MVSDENDAEKNCQGDDKNETVFSVEDDNIKAVLREHESLIRCLHSPDLFLRECLTIIFSSIEEVTVFCSAMLPYIRKNILSTDTFEGIIQLKIVEYCKSYNKYDEVWKAIKDERRAQYDKFYPLWCKVKEKKIYERYQNYSGKVEFAGQRKPQPDDESNDPLVVGNEEGIVRWFHKEFTPSEQALVVATALFQGINRKHVTFLASSIERILFSPVQREQGVD